ncbi:hypothetical protein BDQ17DRAFT_1547523 [Cyathus striatus]|nr:hypothetical protein BDQ17DRAFT_1547523 [Cyathus striatus]
MPRLLKLSSLLALANDILPTFQVVNSESPPPPLKDLGKVVASSIRRCNPGQIVDAVQRGFNMGNDLAIFFTYMGMIVDGNQVTNLMSIGGKTPATGPDPPKPAVVGGLNTHSVFEGDTSMTRNDEYFGDNYSYNETLFKQFEDFSNRFGGGYYDITVASELRWQRTQQSIATNPQFTFVSPRYYTAYADPYFRHFSLLMEESQT